MSDTGVIFDHIHLISADPAAAADWYANVLGGKIAGSYELRGSTQITVTFKGARILIRAPRPGEEPARQGDLKAFEDYVSHDHWGTDHFGFTVTRNLDDFCDELKSKGATFSAEPHDFLPGVRIAFLAAPDNVTIELVHSSG